MQRLRKVASGILLVALFLSAFQTRIVRGQRAERLIGGGAIELENALRGRWRMTCERGWLDVNTTLASTAPPRVQLINVQSTFPPDAEMTRTVASVAKLIGAWDAKAIESLAAPSLDVEKVRRQIAATSSWGTCRVGETARWRR